MQAKENLENYQLSPMAQHLLKSPGGSGALSPQDQSVVANAHNREDALQMDDLNSTGEILAAHGAIEKQMQFLTADQQDIDGGSGFYDSDIQPQKQVLQSMMLQLKERYSLLKEKKRTDRLQRSRQVPQRLSDRAPTDEEMSAKAE